MTMAICPKCGISKFGAFIPCPCGATIENREDAARALILTDHYFSHEQLNEIGESIRAGGQVEIPAEMLESCCNTLGEKLDFVLAQMKKMEAPRRSRKTPK